MAEPISRADAERQIGRLLVRPEFRRLFRARNADGAFVALVAERTDRFADLIERVNHVGGAANVFLPYSHGLMGMVIERSDVPAAGQADINGDATVGVILARLIEDGGSAAYCIRTASAAASKGSVEAVPLVAV